MKYTTEEIKGLLEGITPGEWEYDDRAYYEVEKDHVVTLAIEGGKSLDIVHPPVAGREQSIKDARFIAAAPTIIRILLAENERLSALAAQHLADQELLVGRERKRVARECAEIAANHQSQEFSDGCGTGKFIARTIREHYGVEG